MVFIICNNEEDRWRGVDEYSSSACQLKEVLWKDSGETNATTEYALINPYHVLNVACNATTEEITTAYRKLALLHHPCRCRNQNKEDTVVWFTWIHASYETLVNPAIRQRYDTLSNNLHHEFSPQRQGSDDKDRMLQYGPLADMYQARFYVPFRNPYELFDDVFQSHMFSSSSLPPPNYTAIIKARPKISSSLPTSNQEVALVTEDTEFCFQNILTSICFHFEPKDGLDCRWTNTTTEDTTNSSSFWNNFVPWCCCGPCEGDSNTITPTSGTTAVTSMVVPSMIHDTTSTYLFSDFLQTSKWIGTSKLISRNQHVCQISKYLSSSSRITKTEITKRLDDGTTQTQISVLRRESTTTDHKDDFQKLIQSCSQDTTSHTHLLPQTTKKEKRHRKKHPQPLKTMTQRSN